MRQQIVADVVDIVDDQQHINDAYRYIKEAMREMTQIRHMDGELHRLMKDMYTFEDTLWQFATVEG